ncbi:uncharacterized protein LOC119668107 isoform X2 [Teleopsis dalmanni]|nr:uncharacterized protein LOC119668107 isoform X2 [Teleopsis dalmanni]
MNNDRFFKETYRMSRSTFELLCKHLKSSDMDFRKGIPLEKRVAIALYTLGSATEYRNIANKFGVKKITVDNILLDFCQKVWKILCQIYVNPFPLKRQKVGECVSGFERLGFPQCLGAIGYCHIKVHPTAEVAEDYLNSKGWHSTMLLALVDYKYRFLYINVGAPGRCSASYVFQESALKKQLENATILEEMTKQLGQTQVPVVTIADFSFKLSKRVMKPYPFVKESADRAAYNDKLSESIKVAKNAIGHLKGRFRRIGNVVDNNMQNVNTVIKACCVLHNFLNEHNDEMYNHWVPEENNEELNNVTYYDLVNPDKSGINIRNAIASYLYECDVNDLDEIDVFESSTGEDCADGDGTREGAGNDDGGGDGDSGSISRTGVGVRAGVNCDNGRGMSVRTDNSDGRDAIDNADGTSEII